MLTSSQQALQMIATFTAGQRRQRLMEEPVTPGRRNAFISAGAALTPVAVDGDGLRAEPSLPDPRLIYLTPLHQYPTGAALSLGTPLGVAGAGRSGNRPGSLRTITTASFTTIWPSIRRCKA